MSLALSTVNVGKMLFAVARVDRLACDAHDEVTQPGRRIMTVRAIDGTVGADHRRYATVGSVAAAVPCALLDVVQALAWADEWEEIAVLERRAARLDSPSLAALATACHTALWAATARAVPADVPVHEQMAWLCTAASTLDASYAPVMGWIDVVRQPAGRGVALHDRARAITAQRRHLQALRRALREAPPTTTPDVTTTVVGSASMVPVPALAPFLTAAAREWERPDTPRTHTQLLRWVRRFGVGSYQFPRAGESAEAPRVQVDRAEALATLYRDLPVARAGALIASAQDLIGRVVRDRELLEAVRDRSRPVVGERVAHPEHPAVWRAAVVALGLIGAAPTIADTEAATATGETLSVCAVLLAGTLASPEQGMAIAQSMSRSWSLWHGLITTAMRRLERGRLMTAVG